MIADDLVEVNPTCLYFNRLHMLRRIKVHVEKPVMSFEPFGASRVKNYKVVVLPVVCQDLELELWKF